MHRDAGKMRDRYEAMPKVCPEAPNLSVWSRGARGEQESVHRVSPAPTPQKADPDYIV